MQYQSVPEIAKLAGLISSREIRTYAKVVRVGDGEAVFTDGFGIIQYRNKDLNTDKFYLDRDLNVIEGFTSYPTYSAVVNGKGEAIAVNSDQFINLIRLIGAKKPRGVVLRISPNGVPTIDHDDNTGSDRIYDPWLIKKFILDKKLPIHSVISYEDIIKISYGSLFDVCVTNLKSS